MATSLKFKKKILSIEDLTYLNKLLNVKMPISNALSLITSSRNKKLIDEISNKLNKGALIENIIHDYLPSNIDSYLMPLLKNLPFSAALDISLSFEKRLKENEKQIISSIGYPCLLLFIAITALYFFDMYGINSIFAIIKSFNSDLSLFDSIRTLLRISIYIIYYGFLFISLLALIYSRPKRITYLYVVLSKYLPNSLVHIYYSEQFVNLLLICCKRGYKTKQSLDLLKNMKNKPVISFLAYHLDDYLLKGESLKDASKQSYYDNNLSRFIKIATYSNDFENVLESYVDLAKQRILNKAKRYSLTIQIFTYGFIGIIIIFIYQVLFLPMQALNNL